LNLASANNSTMKTLFAGLPKHFVIHIEEKDAASTNRSQDKDTADSNLTFGEAEKHQRKGVTLSGLLNAPNSRGKIGETKRGRIE
jgi:hypothetical protein